MKLSTAAVSASGLIGFGGQALASGAYYNEPNGPTPLGPAELTFLDDKSIRSFNGGVCVNNFLDEKEREILAKGPQIDHGVWQNLSNSFSGATGKADGCVAISWIKETGKDGFYKAKVRYEWIFTVGEESLVTFGLFNPENNLQRITWKTTYINRKTNNFAWLVRYIEKKDTPQKPNKTEEYGGFKPSEISSFGRLCRYSVKCVDGPEKKVFGEEKGTWEEDEEGQKKFTDGTKNFGPAFDHINEFHNLTAFKMLVNSKTGIGTRR